MAWQLAEAGYTVELDVWDWAAGRNFVTAMSDALERCDRVVALFSAAYFDRSRYTTEEWASAVVHVQATERLVPVRVEEVPAGQVPAVLRTLDIVARSRGVIAPDPGPDLDLFLVFAAFSGGSPGLGAPSLRK